MALGTDPVWRLVAGHGLGLQEEGKLGQSSSWHMQGTAGAGWLDAVTEGRAKGGEGRNARGP